MNNFENDDAYHEGYQARKEGKNLSDMTMSMVANKAFIDRWRTGWNDADHDIIYTTKERDETA